MSYHRTSQPNEINDFTAFGVPSLADVILAVQNADSLAPRLRENLASATRTVVRVIGLPAPDIPASPAFLQARLADIAVVAHGFGESHWANTRSRFAAALRIAGVPLMPGKRRTPLSPTWAEFQRRLPSKWLRAGLSSFAGYGTVLGFEPPDVDDEIFAGFARDLEQSSLVRSPRSVVNRTRRSWNEVFNAGTVGGPKCLLAQPARRDRYSLAWSEFAPSFVQDLEDWLGSQLGDDDPFEELPFKPLRLISIENRRAQIRQIASGWIRRGNDPSTLRSLADLVSLPVAREALRFHLKRRPDKKSKRSILNYACTLLAIARHWVRADEPTIAGLRALARRRERENQTINAKNMQVLRALDSPQASDRLLKLPRRLVRGMRKGDSLTRAQALRVQTALFIEILIVAPIRLRNLSTLDLDRHLERPVDGHGMVMLTFPPDEVKNSVQLRYLLPPATQVLLDLYLTSARTVLCTMSSTLLFPGKGGRPKSYSAIQNQIGKAVYKAVGVRMTPHQFRHAVGKIILDRMPGALSLVSDLLGHRSIETTRRFYTGLDQIRASKSYDKLLSRLREDDPGEEE